MCGIAGIYRLGKRPIRTWQLQMLATRLQYRGDDATGIALMDTKGRIDTLKHASPAWRFTAMDAFEDFCKEKLTPDTQIALIHTRKYTKGSPQRNENNHPIIADAGCIIHNGMVSNDDSLFSGNKDSLKRSCETDSDIFRAILDDHGRVDIDLVELMSAVQGTAAVAAIHPASPGKLLLLRDSNPLILGASPDTLIFASDKAAIHAALKPWVKVHNMTMQVHVPDLSFVPMPDESGWLIGPKGLEDHREFKCNGLRKTGNTKYFLRLDYHERQEKGRAEAARVSNLMSIKKTGSGASRSDVLTNIAKAIKVLNNLDSMPDWVICPNVNCSDHIQLTESNKQVESLANLWCARCNTTLIGAIETVSSNGVN